MNNYAKRVKVLEPLTGDILYLPIAKSEKYLSDKRLNYDLVETSDGCFYEYRLTQNGQLVLLDVTEW